MELALSLRAPPLYGPTANLAMGPLRIQIPGVPQVQILGELASLSTGPSAVWAARYIIRDVLAYRLRREALRRVPDDQVANVVREIDANRPETRD